MHRRVVDQAQVVEAVSTPSVALVWVWPRATRRWEPS